MNKKLGFYKSGFYFIKDDSSSRSIPKNAGFIFNKEKRFWFTENHAKAYRIKDHFDLDEKHFNKYVLIENDTPFLPSRFDIKTGKLNPKYYPGSFYKDVVIEPYQIDTIKFIMSRNKSYARLCPGLGKSLIATMVILETKKTAVYICPPSLVENVREELRLWSNNSLKVWSWYDSHDLVLGGTYNVFIIPDSSIKELLLGYLQGLIGHEEVNVFIDEAHRFKTPDAQRTKYLLGYENEKKGLSVEGLIDVLNIDKVVNMSGTPIPNGSPVELWPIVKKCAHDLFNYMSYKDYGLKYCAGYYDGNGYVFKGHSNMKEFREKIVNKFMIIYKKSVLGLPPKHERSVVLNAKMTNKLARLDSALSAQYTTEDLIKAEMAKKAGTSEDGLHLTTYRRLLGAEKVKPGVQYLRDLLENPNEKILVFFLYTETLDAVAKALKSYDPLVMDGRTPKGKFRQNLVNEFQTNPARRIFLGNITALGTGFTLTKANRVVLFEFSYNDGENVQAGDRAHRKGTTHEIEVDYLVYANSIDRNVVQSLIAKRRGKKYV